MNYYIMIVTKLHQNCILIWCAKNKEAALIDPGGEEKKIIQETKNLNVNVKQILLTHGHIDHVGAAYNLSKYYKIPIIGPHIKDKPLLDNLIIQCKMFNMNFVNSLTPSRWLIDGEKIYIGLEVFNVIHCPGHSPGHVIFLNKKHQLAITGDIIFKESIGRTDLPYANNKILLNSIKKNLMVLSDNTIFLPGHGLISNVGYERKNNLYLL